MSPAGTRRAALVLLLLVCVAHALALRSRAHEVPASRWAALELVAPGLFARGAPATAWPFPAPALPAGRALAWEALDAPASGGASVPSPFVGWIPLWLALAGLLPLGATGRRWLPLALLLGGLAAALALRHTTPLVLALALSAAVGLARIGPRTDGADARPQLVAGALSVLLAAAAIAASLRAGFATDTEALRPLLLRLDAPARAAWDPSSLLPQAAHLRAVLDRSALAAFAGMTALLLHLRSRAPWSAALLLLVTAADLAALAL
jgi:hypothetical protein